MGICALILSAIIIGLILAFIEICQDKRYAGKVENQKIARPA
jgi:hypothetical protein